MSRPQKHVCTESAVLNELMLVSVLNCQCATGNHFSVRTVLRHQDPILTSKDGACTEIINTIMATDP